MYGHPDALSDSVRTAIHFFVNFDIFKWLYLAYFRVYSHPTWGFCKAWSVLYDYVDQIVANPIIYRLIPSASWQLKAVSLQKHASDGLTIKLNRLF